jgi:hypothetical protein
MEKKMHPTLFAKFFIYLLRLKLHSPSISVNLCEVNGKGYLGETCMELQDLIFLVILWHSAMAKKEIE